jgi:hypothetical protein
VQSADRDERAGGRRRGQRRPLGTTLPQRRQEVGDVPLGDRAGLVNPSCGEELAISGEVSPVRREGVG